MTAALALLPGAAMASPQVTQNDNPSCSEASNMEQTPESLQSSSTDESTQSQSTQSQSTQSQSMDDLDTAVSSAAMRPRLGIVISSISPELRSFFGAPSDRGVIIAHIETGSPAERAGLHVGDVLIGVRGQPITQADDVLGALATVGQSSGSRAVAVPLTVVREHQAIRLQARLPQSQQTTSQSDQNC